MSIHRPWPAASTPPLRSTPVLAASVARRLSTLRSALDGIAELCQTREARVPSADFVFNVGSLATVLASEAEACAADFDALKGGAR